MEEYIGKLASRIKKQGTDSSGSILTAEYVSPTAVRIGGELFSHNVFRNPQCTALAGETVLVAHIGNAFYIICKVI